MGYQRAGFEVVGVDLLPQPHYPFEFHLADALTYPLEGFDAIHASPPCPSHSTIRHFQPDPSRFDEADCLPQIRARFAELAVPWVIENVPGAPGPWDLMLCGTMFGIRVRRHRYFQCPLPLTVPPAACRHGGSWICTQPTGAAATPPVESTWMNWGSPGPRLRTEGLPILMAARNSPSKPSPPPTQNGLAANCWWRWHDPRMTTDEDAA